MRFKFCLLFCFAYLFLAGILFAQPDQYPVVRTPQQVAVNHTLPKNILAADAAMPAHFSVNPTDEEIFRVHFFEEPIVPMAGSEVPGENTALVYALAGYSQRTSADDFTSITNFLKQYPQSRWRGALLANLGIVYRRTGYYNLAIDAWQQAWDTLKTQTAFKPKILADRVIAELLLLNAWVGRQEKIDSLLKDIDKRIIEGPAVERVASAHRALWLMKNKPGISFMCGPYALDKIYRITDSTNKVNKRLTSTQSTSKGFSLSELQSLSGSTGLNYQMAFRKPGAEVITNAVVHWKLGHYSALLKEENDHYKCEDATMGTVYGQQFWLTLAAMDSSASGYFLVPAGTLPAGWRTVTPDEGSKIFGKGQEPPDNGKHVTPDDKKAPDQPDDDDDDGNDDDDDDDDDDDCPSGQDAPMAKCNVDALAVSLHIYDRPVYYTPPVGAAISWKVDYHQRDSYQPANFSYANMGPKWTFNWLSYIQDNPANTTANADVYVLGGGARTFTGFDQAAQKYAPELQTNDVLVRICPTCYELRHPNGSKEIYARPDGNTSNGRKIFLTKKVDAAGNVISVLYDANLRIVGLKDTLGQVTTISYENSSDIYKITKVTNPFGKSASFSYDASGRLNSITDMIGIVSSFSYDAGDFIKAMTTPYGTTRFTKADGPGNFRSLETQYPLGEKERVEFTENAAGINSSETIYPQGMNLTNQYLVYRNTFYWDKKAMKDAPGDYTKAKLYHWLHGSAGTGENGFASPLLESIKNPLENRIWYNYQGQTVGLSANQGMSSEPSLIGRVMDDGTTRLRKHFFNDLGADTAIIDAIGRKFSYKYDTTNIDLLEVRQTKNGANDLLKKFTYNNKHLPLTSTDASGLTTTFTYNGFGQVLTIKNPKNEITTFNYNANGYLQNISGPVAGANISFTYDGYGRIRTVTDPEGYTTITDYDALDRPTLITYPDSTTEQIVYDRLDAVHRKDRLGRWSHTIYDSLDRASVMQDALGRVTQYIWCSCGSLAEIVDPLKHVTSFVRDVQGRVISKIFHDGKSISYTYENTTSRLKETTDAKGQKKQYSYFPDDNLKQVDYVNSQVATPSVIYTYDTVYNRMNTMKDGTGTTQYAYKPVNSGNGSGRLTSVDGPLQNDVINYSYDPLGRVLSRSINGISSSAVYDALGRVTTETNALGGFTYNYVNQTERLSSVNFPDGQTTLFDYFDNHGDQRLKTIWKKGAGGTTLSKFDYEFNKEGQITKWTQQAGTAMPTYYDLSYDLSDQLTAATQKNQSTAAIIKRYAYQYDKAGNRTTEQVDNTTTSSEFNNVNQLTRQTDNGPVRFAGAVNKFSDIKIINQTTGDTGIATVDTTNTFEAFVKTTPGTNTIVIKATDYSGNANTTTNNYNITVNAGTANTLAFDNNGNTIFTATPGMLYDWDGEDRLVKITAAYGVTEFIYDGLSRRVAEKLNGTIIKRWLWDGTRLAEERNAGGSTVTKRFFNSGEQINGTNYYFTKDHLGSIREMIAVDGNTVAVRYAYDPYGRRTKVFGATDADFGFTGHYFHASSGLYLTLFRAYDPNTGRWLSRDPYGKSNGRNLYAYVEDNPINFYDPHGLVNLPAIIGNLIVYSVALFALPAEAYLLAAGLTIGTGFLLYDAITQNSNNFGSIDPNLPPPTFPPPLPPTLDLSRPSKNPEGDGTGKDGNNGGDGNPCKSKPNSKDKNNPEPSHSSPNGVAPYPAPTPGRSNPYFADI